MASKPSYGYNVRQHYAYNLQVICVHVGNISAAVLYHSHDQYKLILLV